ncbi:MAG: transposase [Gammaproteobacteria bacterium]|nr:transposase [Gammaproteobacteria bacterium]
MPRKPRLIIPGYPLHVVQRGNNRQPVFRAERDYKYFLRLLREGCDKHGCSVHAYVLMTNHFHLVITPHTQSSIAELMQTIGRHYVRYFNLRNARTGGLWEGRYRSSLIATDRYLLTCYRYVELNPLRAGMIIKPANYPWSSHVANAYGRPDKLVVPHSLYLGLGNAATTRQKAYRRLFAHEFSKLDLTVIRDALRSGRALGEAMDLAGISGSYDTSS